VVGEFSVSSPRVFKIGLPNADRREVPSFAPTCQMETNRAISPLAARYRYPSPYDTISYGRKLSGPRHFFRFDSVTCYGKLSAEQGGPLDGRRPELSSLPSAESLLSLPFDLDEVIRNLTHECYLDRSEPPRFASQIYYALRPILPAPARVCLQRLYLRKWRSVPFPSWPVDTTVERLLESVLRRLLLSNGTREVPFIWFWPNGCSGAVVVTHDVETEAGLRFCRSLMDTDESFAIPASFQLVPESRYHIPPQLLDEIRTRGHEVNIQDLNHDGRLFFDHSTFLKRVKEINRYGRVYGARGFRSAILYRNLKWFRELEFAYDMSVPNVGHLEAQRGGCCTVFPYFLGDLLEIPVTTTQDYTLFRLLRDHRIDLWKEQANRILERNGLVSFIAHPDYLQEPRAASVYAQLAAWLNDLRSERRVWVALPGQVNDWWRRRAQMELRFQDGRWAIVGQGSEEAVVAHARLQNDRVVYSLGSSGC
jgi:hypothetical protein